MICCISVYESVHCIFHQAPRQVEALVTMHDRIPTTPASTSSPRQFKGMELPKQPQTSGLTRTACATPAHESIKAILAPSPRKRRLQSMPTKHSSTAAMPKDVAGEKALCGEPRVANLAAPDTRNTSTSGTSMAKLLPPIRSLVVLEAFNRCPVLEVLLKLGAANWWLEGATQEPAGVNSPDGERRTSSG